MHIGDTIGQAILAALADGKKSMQELYQRIPAQRASINKARQRLLKAGKIERVARGVYCLKGDNSDAAGAEISEKNISEADKLDQWLNLIEATIYEACETIDKAWLTREMPLKEKLEYLDNFLQSCANLGLPVANKIIDDLRRDGIPEAYGFDFTIDALFADEEMQSFPLQKFMQFLLQVYLETHPEPETESLPIMR